MKQENERKDLRGRIRAGEVSRRDVNRRLAELAFGKANDCMRLALEEEPDLGKLDLSLLREIKRSSQGGVEIKLIDRLEVLKLLEELAEEENGELDAFLQALKGGEE